MIVWNKSVNLYLGDQNHWFIVQLQISYNRQHSFFDTNGFSWSCNENERCFDSNINATHCNAIKHRIIISSNIFFAYVQFCPVCTFFLIVPVLSLAPLILFLAVPVWPWMYLSCPWLYLFEQSALRLEQLKVGNRFYKLGPLETSGLRHNRIQT